MITTQWKKINKKFKLLGNIIDYRKLGFSAFEIEMLLFFLQL